MANREGVENKKNLLSSLEVNNKAGKETGAKYRQQRDFVESNVYVRPFPTWS